MIIWHMASAKKYMSMVIFMKENGAKIDFMGLGLSQGEMVIILKVNGKMILFMDMARRAWGMEKDMLAIMSTV